MQHLLFSLKLTFFGVFLLSSMNPPLIYAACTTIPIAEGGHLFDEAWTMRVSEDGKTAFVMDRGAGSVYIVDTTEKAVVKVIKTGEYLGDMVLNPIAGLLYVSDEESGQIQVLDVSSRDFKEFRRLDALQAGHFPGAIAYDAASDRVFVADLTAPNIMTVFPSNVTEPVSMALNSKTPATKMLIANGKLYVSFETSNTVGIYDVSTATPDFEQNIRVDKRPTAMAISDDGKRLYVANTGADTISVIDTTSQAVINTIEHSNLLSAPVGLAYLNGILWIANQSSGEVVHFDTQINDLVNINCDLGGVRPNNLLALPTLGVVYVTHSDGVEELHRTDTLSIQIRQGNASTYSTVKDIVTQRQETFDLQIVGGIGRFEMSGTAGMQVQPITERHWQITAPTLIGEYTFYIEDKGSQETLTIPIRVGGAMTLLPSGPIEVELGGQSRYLEVAGGFAPYRWTVQNGILSSFNARYVIYTPQVTGTDTVTVRDSAGTQLSLTINVTVSGVSVTPAVAVMLAGETRIFHALGGTTYTWDQQLGGTISQTEGNSTEFTAPNEIGTYHLILRDTLTAEIAQAVIHVISDELRITPAEQSINRNDSTPFQVVGGRGPYIWSSQYGDLSTTEGSINTYTAPQVTAIDTLSVTDNGGRVATAKINVTGNLLMSPLTAVLTRGETLRLALNNATGEVNWLVISGELLAQSNNGTQYQAPNRTGRYSVIATDAANRTAQATIFVVSDALNISPSEISLKQGESTFFTVTGGKEPYIWAAQMGTLSVSEGKTVFMTAPSTVPTEPFTVSVEDSLGNLAVAQVTVSSQQGGLYGYDGNSNGQLERSELYFATEDFVMGRLDASLMLQLLQLFFEHR
jgi:YVTN family beta-propeller protein